MTEQNISPQPLKCCCPVISVPHLIHLLSVVGLHLLDLKSLWLPEGTPSEQVCDPTVSSSTVKVLIEFKGMDASPAHPPPLRVNICWTRTLFFQFGEFKNLLPLNPPDSFHLSDSLVPQCLSSFFLSSVTWSEFASSGHQNLDINSSMNSNSMKQMLRTCMVYYWTLPATLLSRTEHHQADYTIRPFNIE